MRRTEVQNIVINGIVNIYKEAGFTSHDVVAKLRGIVKQKKIGHTGTLDPEAVGVLPVCFGNATKLCDMLTDKSKEYEACMLLGVTTDTQDMSGTILSKSPVEVTQNQIEEAIMSFIGEYDQIPPMFSAIKVNGKKLYELAREGKVIERNPRRVKIHSITIESMELPNLTFKVNCSKGTYIRALCADIGEKLGCGAAMSTLKRTRVGTFGIEQALTLKQVEELVSKDRLMEYVIPSDKVFENYCAVRTNPQSDKVLANGNKLYIKQIETDEPKKRFLDGELVRVYNSQKIFTGVYEYVKAENIFKPYKMFF